ncbi:MAG: cytochrome D1 domain-containing protein [Bacteroidota bacterium]
MIQTQTPQTNTFFIPLFLLVALLSQTFAAPPTTIKEGPSTEGDLVLRKTIYGNIFPKSIALAPNGRFFAQNMMYRHSVTVYDRNFRLIKTLSDRIMFSDYNIPGFKGTHQGSPVEVAFSPDGKYAWVSNYKMYGLGFDNPGKDDCKQSPGYDHSFLYKINTYSLKIEGVIEVGCVPKYLTITPDGRRLIVSNWCSGDISIVDTETEREIERVSIGEYPRGIEVDSKGRYAYIAVMGDDRIAVLKLSDMSLSWIPQVGKRPRHLCMTPSDRYLYVSLSGEGAIAQIDMIKRAVIRKTNTGESPRSMTLSPDGLYLYVVNYLDNTISKLSALDLSLIETVKTNDKPIGITFDPLTRHVWVACYSGSIQIFEDTGYENFRVERDESLSSYQQPLPSRNPDGPMSYIPGKDAKNSDPYYYIYRDKEKANQEMAEGRPVRTRTVAPANEPTSVSPRPESLPAIAHSRSASPAPQTPRVDKKFYVIVGSYAVSDGAEKFARSLRSRGYQASVLPRENGRFRVSCGVFGNKSQASQLRSRYNQKYKAQAWILAK